MGKAALAVKAEPVPITKRRGRPNIEGVPGTLVSLPADLVFGKSLRASPYDPLLEQLAAAPPQQVLRFEHVRAKPSIYSRAKKLGMLVGFAESGGALYVKFLGRVDDGVKETRRGKIREALAKFGPMTHIVITNKLREGGDQLADAGLVETILLQMHKAGEVVRAEGNLWRMNPTFKPGK